MADEAVEEEPSTSTPNAEEAENVCRACDRPMLGKTRSNGPLSKPEAKSNFRFSTSQDNVLCTACKKFYCRYRNKIQESACACIPGDKKCRFCRYQRCKNALFEKKAIPNSPQLPKSDFCVEKVDFTALPCVVCGCSSSGFHFGVVSCEGCKGFFRRSMTRTFKVQYQCKGLNKGEEEGQSSKPLCPQGSNCRKCRLQRCLDAGMSLNEIAIGRHTIRRRVQIDATLRKHFVEGSFLKSKILRRKRPASENRDSKTPISPPIKDSSSTGPSLEHQNSAAEQQLPTSEGEMHQKSPTSLSSQLSQTLGAMDQAMSQDSFESLIDQTVNAAARLSKISTFRLRLTYEMTRDEMMFNWHNLLESYVKCVSEFITCLPGINRVSLADRLNLFTQAFFPVTIVQLSLNFDVERQITNHFSIERDGPTWEICHKEHQEWQDDAESFLLEAGNLLCRAIGNLKEFSLCCALLLFNSDTPNLGDASAIRTVRRHYEMAVLHYFSADSCTRAEERLSKFYQLLCFLRRATTLFHDTFVAFAARSPQIEPHWTSLIFRQFFWQILNSAPSPSVSTQSSSPC